MSDPVEAQDEAMTPEQVSRANAERDLSLYYTDGRPKMHRHFAQYEVHSDENCTQRGTPRRVYVFDEEDLDRHERFISARVAAEALRDASRAASGRWNVKPYVDQWLLARADAVEDGEVGP